MKYNTKTRKLIINFLKNNEDKHLTIREIAKSLNVPQATAYRIIDSLEKEGVVRKYSIDSSTPNCYQISDDSHHHFHLVCTKCGKIVHLECDEVNNLMNHISDEHGFNVDISKVNLYGLCDECKGK